MGAGLDEFEKMKADAMLNAYDSDKYLYELKRDIEYFGIIVNKTERGKYYTLFITVPERSELTIELEPGHCNEAAGEYIAKYFKQKVQEYLDLGEKAETELKVKMKVYNRLWTLEDADTAVEKFERDWKSKESKGN